MDMNTADAMYGHESSRPSRKQEASKRHADIVSNHTSEETSFVAEFPSLTVVLCSCEETSSLETAFRVSDPLTKALLPNSQWNLL